MPEAKNYWSECGQISFCSGEGFGLTHTLQTVCLGGEDAIKKFFETGELNDKFTPEQKAYLSQLKEDYYGDTGTASVERGSTNGASRRNPKATGLLASRKRLPLRPSRTKSKGLSRR